MGLFSPFREKREINSHGPRVSTSSFDHTRKHRSPGIKRRSPKDAPIRDLDAEGRADCSNKAPDSPSLRTSYQVTDQDTIQIYHRKTEDLIRDSFNDIIPDTATNYPCTQRDLNASGGVNRRTAQDAYKLKNKTNWFAHSNNGPFIDPRLAAREVFDHNNADRTPSAAESEAISRLIAGFNIASQGYWGPDLIIKAFCDLDKVLFCGRLRGHVCVNFTINRSVKEACFATSLYLGQGKSVIQLNAISIFSSLYKDSGFHQMWATMLHEMW